MAVDRFHPRSSASVCLVQIAATLHTLCCTATAEDMKYPLSAAVAAEGTLYVADRDLPGIWRIVDGTPSVYFEGSKKFRTPLNAVRCLAVDGRGNLLAGDSSTRQVYRFDDSAKPVPVLENSTGLGIPMSMAVAEDGTLFIADLETQRIWKVPSSGGVPVEFVTIPAPRGLAFDNEGRLWVVSQGENQLLRVTPDGVIEPVVRGRPFRFPHNVVLDKHGTAYVSDGYAKTIWKIEPSGEPQAWIAGEPLANPVGLAWRGKTLIIVDPHARVVFAADAAGKLTAIVSAASADD